MRKIFCLIILSSLLFVPKLYAGGLDPIGGIGARAKGMGGAGMATAEGAAAFYYNPALLVESGSFAEAGADYIGASFTYKDPAGNSHKSDLGEYYVPISGFSYRKGDWSAGIGLTTPYVFGADFEKSLGMLSKICLIDISPAVAYKVSKDLSIGAALTIGNSNVRFISPIFNPFTGQRLGTLETRADGWGLGYQVGLLYKPVDPLAFSLAYQSPVRVELGGRTTAFLPAPLGFADNFSSTFTFPGRLSFGARLRAEKLLVAADLSWFDYSQTKRVDLAFEHLPRATMSLDWKDNLSFNMGAEYELLKGVFARTGFGYQTGVIPDRTISPATPDMDGWNASAGLGWRGEHWGMDAAYTHAWGEERRVPRRFPGAGSYSADISIVSAAINYRF